MQLTQETQPPWWWRTEVLARMAVALLAVVAAAYLVRWLGFESNLFSYL
jgi:hypothetical protein